MTNEPSAPQTEGRQPTVERGGLWALMFSSAAFLLPPYGIALSVLGIVQGARARKSAKSNGAHAPGAVLSIIVGAIGIVWGLGMGAVGIVFADELSALNECTARANTVSTQDQCDAAYEESIQERFPDYPQLSELLDR